MRHSNAARVSASPGPAASDHKEVGAVSLAPKVAFRRAWAVFSPILRPYRVALIALIVLTLATPIASGSIVWVFRHLIDDVVSRGTTDQFWHYGLLFAVASTGTSILRFLDELLTGWVQTHFVRDSRALLLDHVLQLPPDHFDRNPMGDTLARLSTDVSAVEGVFVSATLSAISSAAQVLVLGAFAFALNWRLTLLALLVIPPFALLARVFSTRMRRVARERRRRGGSAGAVAEEILSGIGVVQAHNAEHRESQRFEQQAQAIIRADLAGTRLSAIYRPAIDTIELLGGLVVVWFGTLLVGRQQLTLGTMLAFMAYATQLYSPVRSLSRLSASMQNNLAGVDRVIELLDTPVPTADNVGAPPPIAARVEFDGVSFAYPASGGEVVSGIGFVLEPGRSVALVGPSGSGKSTIARLLLGWYQPSAGVIRVNGREIGAGDVGLVRDAVSYLPQEPWLFDGSVADNIAYGRPEASRAEICAAAQAADAHEFICELPAGYDSSVGRRGRLLSGGQRQRVALARAFLRNSPILVLDEPLTALDPLSADRIVPALRRLMVGRATLVISHHLELAEHSDLVLVLQQGRIVESGTHDWLLTHGDIYRQLHRN
ncbi:MAG: ABC transporter ATP-binding protein, partial [Actinobacteria bacterium]|nr:ABC transporter ATP-binding protein [Actinomycetota bacterium]